MTRRFNPRNKYGVGEKSRRQYRDWTFDSIAECKHAMELDLLLEAEVIDWWMRQVRVDLTDDDRYCVDFVVSREGHVFAQEIKGAETTAWRRNKKLWDKYGPFPMEVIKNGKTTEVLMTRKSQLPQPQTVEQK